MSEVHVLTCGDQTGEAVWATVFLQYALRGPFGKSSFVTFLVIFVFGKGNFWRAERMVSLV